VMKTEGMGAGRWRTRLLPWLIAVGLTASAGCCSTHVVDPPSAELVAACRSIPKCARDHVHIIFVGGADWCDWANITGVREYLAELGFCQSHMAQCYHLVNALLDVKRVHKEDPDARFVLVGFSLGANMVSTITRCVKDDGIPIELLVYCGGNSLCNKPRDQPDNARHIANILATGWVFNGAQLDRAENISEPDVFHFGTPAHPRTVALLVHHLAAIAADCPHDVVISLELPPLETAPTPRPVEPPPADQPRDEWDFLKPAPGQLKTLPPDPNAVKPEDKPIKGFFGGKPLPLILSGQGGS
jgi:hypothetical protein